MKCPLVSCHWSDCHLANSHGMIDQNAENHAAALGLNLAAPQGGRDCGQRFYFDRENEVPVTSRLYQ